MKTFILSFCLFAALPSLAWANAPERLVCLEDSNNSDPYKQLKDSNTKRMITDAEPLRKAGVKNQIRADMLTSLLKDYVHLCKARKMLESLGTAYEYAASDAAVTQGKGALDNISNPTQTIAKAGSDFDQALNTVLTRQKANFNKYFAEDVKAVPQAVLSKPEIKTSFRNAWGVAPGETPNPTGGKTGQFSSLIRQIEGELAYSKVRQPELEALAKKVEENKEKAASLNKDILASAKKPDDFGNLGNDSTKTDTDTDTDTGTGTNDTKTDTDNSTYTPGPNSLNNQGPGKETNGGLGGWASRNKGAIMLGVGTAAVVGGVLWYRNKKDKEKEAEERYSPIGSHTSTSTSTATNTITDTNGFSLSVSGFPTSATVGKTIDTIVVSITGPEGQNTDGVQVTLACTSDCPIAGTLTQTTSGGKAEFSDISFNAKKEGVQLRVSAPNLNSVASPGSFNVDPAERE